MLTWGASFCLIYPSFLHGFVTLFTWLSKKCYEAFQQEMHREVPIGAKEEWKEYSYWSGFFIVAWMLSAPCPTG